MNDIAEIHAKLSAFLAGELARKEGRQCIGVDLRHAPGYGCRPEEIHKWARVDQPELFDDVEQLVAQIVAFAMDEADAKVEPGKHRFVVMTRQFHNDRATHSFKLSPHYSGSAGDEAVAVPQTSSLLAELLAQQNTALLAELSAALAENRSLRRKLEEAEKKARSNIGSQPGRGMRAATTRH
jgi:hypothetical protein